MEKKVVMRLKFNKKFSNDSYELFFNTKTGVELLRGINGKPDPFWLELPSLLDIGIMGECKNKCRICYQGHEKEDHMKLQDFKRIINEVKGHTNQVALGGRGDPNHHPHFKEIIKHAAINKVVPNYTTSGINLTSDQIDISKKCGAVAVSDYNQKFTYKAINNLINANIKTNIHLVFSQESYNRCLRILYGYNPWKIQKYQENIGSKFDLSKLNAVVFLLFKPQGASKLFPELTPTRLQMISFSERVFEPQCEFKVGMDSCLVNYVTSYSEPKTPLQAMCIDTCEAARMSAYITPDMKLMPCSFADKKTWSVSLHERTIEDVWKNSKPFKRFREILTAVPNKCPLGF